MRYLDVPPSLETLRDYVIPALFKKSKGSPAQILEKLGSHTGRPLVVLVPAVMQYLLSERNIEQAIQFGKATTFTTTCAYLSIKLMYTFCKNSSTISPAILKRTTP